MKASGAYGEGMTIQFIRHVSLTKESHHQHLLLLHVQARATVDVPIQMAPTYT